MASSTEATASGPAVSPGRLNAGLTILRLVVGSIFIAHGAQKTFTIGLDSIGAMMSQSGIPMGEVVGPTVALVELLGGAALVLGLFSRVAAVGLALVMAGAVIMVHFPEGFFNPKGFEFPLSLLGATTALALMGPGRLSVDSAVRNRRIDG